MKYSKVEIEAAIPFKHDFMPLANILYLILPYFLKSKNIECNHTRAKKVFDDLFDTSLASLPKDIKRIEESSHLSNLSKGKQYLKYLPKFVEKLKLDQTVKSFKAIEKKVFNSFFNVYTEIKDYDPDLEFILSKVPMLDNKALRLSVKSIDYTHADPVKSYELHNSKLEELNKKFFGSINTPSNKAIEKLRIDEPKKYKELKDQRDIIKEKSWTIINDVWQNEIEEEFITSEQATELCEKAGIKLFPHEFEGLIRQNPVKGTELEFYTTNGERLDKFIGANAVNLEMGGESNRYYCKFNVMDKEGNIPLNPKKEPIFSYRYKLDTKAENAKTKFEKTGMLGHQIVGMSDRFDTPGDLLSKIRKNVFAHHLEFGNKQDKLCALLCIIGDMTCARLGTNKGEDGNKVDAADGIHTITSDSMTVSGSTITISYEGKKTVSQVHTISPSLKTVYSELTDSSKKKSILKLVIEELILLKNSKLDKELLFTLGNKNIAISEKTVNEYLKKNGWPGTYHTFRTYFGCKTFYREMMLLKGSSLSQEEAEEEFNRIVKIVSDHLGNSPEAAIGAYIDKELVKEFFNMTKAGVPSSVLKTIAASQGALEGVREYIPEKKKVKKEEVKKKEEESEVKKRVKKKVGIGTRITIFSNDKEEDGTIFRVVEKEDGEIVYLIELDNGTRKRLSSTSEYILNID